MRPSDRSAHGKHPRNTRLPLATKHPRRQQCRRTRPRKSQRLLALRRWLLRKPLNLPTLAADPAQRQLLDGIHPLKLGSLAFDMLAALVECGHRVAPKHELCTPCGRNWWSRKPLAGAGAGAGAGADVGADAGADVDVDADADAGAGAAQAARPRGHRHHSGSRVSLQAAGGRPGADCAEHFGTGKGRSP